MIFYGETIVSIITLDIIKTIEMVNCNTLEVPFQQKLAYWMTNVWVIILLFLVILIVMIMVLYTVRPSVVLDNGIEKIDNARLILTAIIIASFIMIGLWLVVQIYIRKIKTNNKK